MDPSGPTRNRSASIYKPVQKDINHIKISRGDEEEEEESEDEDEDDDDCEENFGDHVERRGKSISELISLHKLNTAKPIASKLQSKPEVDNSSESSEDVVSQRVERRSPLVKKAPINQCGAFEWCDEFDDIINDNNENFEKPDLINKYDQLSAFMEIKSTQIRKMNSYKTYKDTRYNNMNAKKPQENILRFDTVHQEEEPIMEKKLSKARSHNPELMKDKNLVYESRQKREPTNSMLQIPEDDQSIPPSSLVGYIDPFGVFIANVEVAGIDLCSSSLTEDVGFFDKLTLDGALKSWRRDMLRTFNIFRRIFTTVEKHQNTLLNKQLMRDMLNTNYFERNKFTTHFDEMEFT